MVGEIQSPLSVFPNRDKDQLNTNVGSESSISLLRKDIISIQNPYFIRKFVLVYPQKVNPFLKRVMTLKKLVLLQSNWRKSSKSKKPNLYIYIKKL